MTKLKTAARETIDTGNNFNSITRTLVGWVVSESQDPFTPDSSVVVLEGEVLTKENIEASFD